MHRKHFVADLTLGLGKVVFDYLAAPGVDRPVVRNQPRLVHAIEAATR